jgi:hypothetical protein
MRSDSPFISSKILGDFCPVLRVDVVESLILVKRRDKSLSFVSTIKGETVLDTKIRLKELLNLSAEEEIYLRMDGDSLRDSDVLSVLVGKERKSLSILTEEDERMSRERGVVFNTDQ